LFGDFPRLSRTADATPDCVRVVSAVKREKKKTKPAEQVSAELGVSSG
jgi:hypothetical protein